MTFCEAGPVPAQGQIAQQIFWYTAFTADMIKPGLPVVNADGTPKWRMAPGPHGPYWKEGMKHGYQDVGSWTFFEGHDANKTAAAWLYAQFVTSKTTLAEEDHRRPDLDSRERHPGQGDHRPRAEARRPGRVLPQPGARGLDARPAPTCPTIRSWRSCGGRTSAMAVTGEKTPQAAMDTLAEEMDQVMARLERAGMARCAPKLNPKSDPNKWLSDKSAPWKKLANEKPKGETIAYDTLLNAWKAGKVR